MSTEQAYSCRSGAVERACEAARDYVRSQGRAAIVAATYEDVVRVKHELARRGWGFGIAVETPAAWIVDLWETYGDGRALVSPVDRALLVRKAMKQSGSLETTKGMVKLVSDAARNALPFMHDAPEGLSDQEEQVRACLIAYESLLERYGLVEESSACAVLSDIERATQYAVVALACDTSPAQDLLFERMDLLRVTVDVTLQGRGAGVAEGEGELASLRSALFHPDFENPVQPQGQIRFALPAGGYVQPLLLAEQIAEMAKRAAEACSPDESIQLALVAKDPNEMHGQIARSLERLGLRVDMRTVVAFPSTPFGRAWFALRLFEAGQDREQLGLGHMDARFASDFDMSMFSFMGLHKAASIDKDLRSWRGHTIDDSLDSMVSGTPEEQRGFLECVKNGQIAEALRLQAAWVGARTNWPESYRAQQQAAISAAQDIYARAAEFDMEEGDVLDVLLSTIIPFSSSGVEQDGRACVRIVRMGELARADKESFHGVIMADMTASAYPLKHEKRALDYFLESFGVRLRRDPVAQQRMAFSQCLDAARCEVLLCRQLNDVDAEEQRPAALLEELIDCYRSRPQDIDELDKKLGIPDCLKPFSSTKGEEDLSVNIAALQGASGVAAQLLHRDPLGQLSQEDVQNVICQGLILSPSAIESFLDCPYKWFAERNLRLKEIDADFGPRAFGTFAHGVLERLHMRLVKEGMGRVTQDSLAGAQRLLGEEFDRLMEEERERVASDAFIPLSHTEMLKAESLRATLKDYLAWEADFLPEFVPYGSEVSFGRDNPFEYAGFKLVGSVDRVDVDASGRAAIIDYKGSVRKEHNFRIKDAEEWALPRKVQAAIYAQVVRRHLGLQPVAALYVSYNTPGSISGLYDRSALHEARDLPGINAETCGSVQMLDDLDRCEKEIARRLEALTRGEIAPCPVDAEACKYCPVGQCERRLS